jgi:hypothetical protein
MQYPIIYHGSENSLDVDAYVIIPEALEHKAAKPLCDSFKEINANLLVVNDGQVVWSYKGTTDECNNSILSTYSLHKQNVANPITKKAEREYGLKMLRTVRGLLSYNSRTPLRVEVKKALVTSSLEEKIDVLKMIDLTQVTDFQKSSLIETYKFFAFQMGQCLALLEDNVELFTKNQVSQYYPSLKPYLDRKQCDAVQLQKFYERFVEFVDNNYTKIEKQQLYCTNFHGKKEVLDAKKEKTLPPVVVFDIDGTLMDETHRRHHMEKKDWDSYFDACHLDTPIPAVVNLAKDYYSKGYEVWLMTGRSESCKDKTVQSMKDAGVEFHYLRMRGKDVMIPDYVLKPAWICK